eukprot:SAG31_NODE_8578_length_1427_cov_1.479669_1_plen_30_part_10
MQINLKNADTLVTTEAESLEVILSLEFIRE